MVQRRPGKGKAIALASARTSYFYEGLVITALVVTNVRTWVMEVANSGQERERVGYHVKRNRVRHQEN
jgi:hypothetical protein